mmetsp:Transcript_14106/g.55554  ORF Transcript_14106/g.55554 Transcript_14106/m.55554 type:complete len:267 (-) Transcript_14106:996-1796(-)
MAIATMTVMAISGPSTAHLRAEFVGLGEGVAEGVAEGWPPAGVGVLLNDSVGVDVKLGLTVAVFVGEAVGESDAAVECVAVAVAVIEAVAVEVKEGLAVAVSDAVLVSVGRGDFVGEGTADLVGVSDGVTEGVLVVVFEADLDNVGVGVAVVVFVGGANVSVGVAVRVCEGVFTGEALFPGSVAVAVGVAVEDFDADGVGDAVGDGREVAHSRVLFRQTLSSTDEPTSRHLGCTWPLWFTKHHSQFRFVKQSSHEADRASHDGQVS